MAKDKLSFVEVHRAESQSGGALAVRGDYVFEQDGREYCARVTWEAVRTLEGQLSPDEVKLAAETFLENYIGNGWIQPGETAELDSNAMEVVATKLRWVRRFHKLMER